MSPVPTERRLPLLVPGTPGTSAAIADPAAALREPAASSSTPSANGEEAPDSDVGAVPHADSPDHLFQVGELARMTGKTVRAIHLYETLGLLRPQDRSKGRFRLFSEDSVLRVRWITKLQDLGLSLSEIQELARSQEGSASAQFAATRLREVYRTKLAETRTKLEQLAALEAELEASLAYLETCDQSCVPQIPVGGCERCQRHAAAENAPDLVAGMRAH